MSERGWCRGNDGNNDSVVMRVMGTTLGFQSQYLIPPLGEAPPYISCTCRSRTEMGITVTAPRTEAALPY